jgi:hypothetical protein
VAREADHRIASLRAARIEIIAVRIDAKRSELRMTLEAIALAVAGRAAFQALPGRARVA